MKYEVKIILYPDVAKSKNGEFFERLMRNIFEVQGYELTQNINFTGLEIDLYGKHKIRNENLLIECKAKQEPRSTEIKNFLFNICMEKKADFGYFLHTEELHHQAAGLVDEWTKKEESKKFAFVGPKKIIEILSDAGVIKPFSLDLPKAYMKEKLILCYTYFGIFYILIVNTGSSVNNSFYVLDATSIEEVQDLSYYPNQEYSKDLTFEQIIKREITEIKDLTHKRSVIVDNPIVNSFVELDDKFSKYLQNPGANYLHSQTSDLILDDIFVAPDLKELNLKVNKKIYNFPNLLNLLNIKHEEGIRYVFTGEETSGKTTVCKFLFMYFYHKGLIPIWINGEDLTNNIRIEFFEKMAVKNFGTQYIGSCKYETIPKDKIFILIDDFHKVKVKSGYRTLLVQNICSRFKNIVITGNTLMPLESVLKNRTTQDIFEKFKIYTLLEFGPKLRYELVRKWNTLGQDERLMDVNELFRKNDNAITHIAGIIGKNYVPSYPFYILTILQAMEGAGPSNVNYSLHGFYYELIINDSLNKAVKDKKEISLYLNYITSLCYYFFENKTKVLSIVEFEEFHKSYCKKHDVRYGYKDILLTLQSAKLIDVNGIVTISHKYVYYFFVAKYLTNNISKHDVKQIIGKMCQRLYREEFGNIIMFLTHLSKDEFIIGELVNNAKSIFSDVPVTKLDEDVNKINQLIKELPKQVLDIIDVNKAREEELDHKEENERIEKEFDKIKNKDQEYDLDENVETIDFIVKLTLALKNVEILGQVAKKYWGEMTGDQKYEVVSETYFLALRTLNTYLLFMEDNAEVLVNQIAGLIDKKHLKDRFRLKQKVGEVASDFVFRLCFLASYSIIRRVTDSIGYDKLDTTFKNIASHYPTNAVKLIDLSIKLDYYNKFPIEEIEESKKSLDGNKLGYLILKNLVVNYLYMFNTDYKLKAKLCRLLEIELKQQYVIDATSKVKKE